MAYIKFNSGFNITSHSAIDPRLILSKFEMLSAEEDYTMPDVYFAICRDDGNLYTFNKQNQFDSETGKFRIIAQGEGGIVKPGYIVVSGVEPDTKENLPESVLTNGLLVYDDAEAKTYRLVDTDWVEEKNNYTQLTNRPVINSKTVEGNRTADYYGLQDKLVSGTNIKTVNGQSILGAGDMSVSSASITVYVDDEQSIYSGGIYQITDGQFKILKDNKDAKIIAVVKDLGQLEKISDVTLIFEQQTRSINTINDTDIITFMHKACNDDFSSYDFSATAYTEYNDDGFWYCYVKFNGIAINYNHLSYRPQLNGTILSGNVRTKTINGQSIMGTGNIDISGTNDLFVDPYRDDATENNQNLARTRTMPFAPLSNGVIDGEFEINLNKDFRTGGSNWEYLEEYNCYYPMMNNIEYYPSGAHGTEAKAYYFLDKSWWAVYPHRIYFNKDEHTLNSLAFWMSASYSIDSRTGQVAAAVPAVTVKVKAYKNGEPESAGNVICSDLVLPAIPAGTHIDSVDEYSRYVHLIDLEQFDSIGFEFATDGKKRVNIAFCQGSISEDTTLYKWDALATKDELNKTADQFIDELNGVRIDVELNAGDIAINAARFDEFQTEVNSKLGNVRVQNVKNLPDPKEEVVNVIFKHNNDIFVCEKSGELIDRTFDLHELTGTNSISTAGQIEAVEREAFKNYLKIDSIVKGARNNGEIKLGNSSTTGAITFKIGTSAEIADMPLSRISFDIRSFYEDRPSHFDIVTYNEDQGESFVQGSYDLTGIEHFDIDLNEFVFTYEDTISIIGDRAPEYDGRFYLDNVNVIFGEAEYSYAELAKVGEGEFKTINGIEITGEGDIDTNPKTVIYLTTPITSITTAGRTWTLSSAILSSFMDNPNLGVLLAYKINGTQISYNFTKYADTRTTSSNSFYLTFVYDHITTLADASMVVDSYVFTIRSTGEAKLYKAANPIDYDDLLNRPSINGTVLTGDCSVKTVNGESVIGEGNIETRPEITFALSTPITNIPATGSTWTLTQEELDRLKVATNLDVALTYKQGSTNNIYKFVKYLDTRPTSGANFTLAFAYEQINQATPPFTDTYVLILKSSGEAKLYKSANSDYNKLSNRPSLSGRTISGNIPLKTINNESILGNGNIDISAPNNIRYNTEAKSESVGKMIEFETPTTSATINTIYIDTNDIAEAGREAFVKTLDRSGGSIRYLADFGMEDAFVYDIMNGVERTAGKNDGIKFWYCHEFTPLTFGSLYGFGLIIANIPTSADPDSELNDIVIPFMNCGWGDYTYTKGHAYIKSKSESEFTRELTIPDNGILVINTYNSVIAPNSVPDRGIVGGLDFSRSPISSSGMQNDILTGLFSFDEPFVVENTPKGLFLYNDDELVDQANPVIFKTVNGESVIGEGNIKITEEVYFNISTPITTTAQTISLNTQLYQKILEKILDNPSIRIIVDEKYQGELTTRYAFTMKEVTINNNDITSISYVCTKTAPNQAPATFRVYEAKLAIATVSTLTLVERKIKYGGLDNLPQINGHVLTGNLASGALGLQDQLISGTNIKTINNESILGSGNINIGLGGDTYTKEDFTNIEGPMDPRPLIKGIYSTEGLFGGTIKAGCHTTVNEDGVDVNERIRLLGYSESWFETYYPEWADATDEEKAAILELFDNGIITSDHNIIIAGASKRPLYVQGEFEDGVRKELALLEDTRIGNIVIEASQVVTIDPLLTLTVTDNQQAILEDNNIAIVNIDASGLGDPGLTSATFTKTPSSVPTDIMMAYTSVSYLSDGKIADTRQYFIRYDTITKTATLDTQIINRPTLPNLPAFDPTKSYSLKLIPNATNTDWTMTWVED